MKSHFARIFLGLLVWTLLGTVAAARTLDFQTTQVTDADVTVSPDSKVLVFSILGHLFRMPVEGGGCEQLTFGPCYDNDPVFSPDGLRVAFVSDRDNSGGNVFVLDLASNKLTQVTHETHAGQPTWMPDGKAILYLRYLPPEENPRPRSLFGGPTLCELRKIAMSEGARPETLRRPGFLKSIFLLADAQPAWTVVEQEAGSGGFRVRSTTHVETLTGKDSKVVRLRTIQGDLGRVEGSSKGDGFYYRSTRVHFLPLAKTSDPAAPTAGGGPGFGPGSSATRFAVTVDGKFDFQSQRGRLVKL